MIKCKRFILLTIVSAIFSTMVIGCGNNTSVVSEGDDVRDMSDEVVVDESEDSTFIVEKEFDDNDVKPIVHDGFECKDVLVSSESMLHKSAHIVDVIGADDNIMYSPLSLNFALGLIVNGMNEDGKSYMSSYFGDDIDSYNLFVENYMKSLPNTVEIANGLFVDDKSSFNENTLSILEKSYSAGCDVLDFSSPSSVEYINNWCNESTHGMIPGIVSDLNGYSLVAANALYFKDNWLSQIDDNRVMEDGKFTTINGDIQTCNMMLMSEDRYLENDKAIGFIKPYANQRYGFVAILPKEQGLFNFSDLDVDSLMNSVEYDATVIASMPEFSFDSTLSLTAVLRNLGLSGLFENAYCDSLLDNEIAIVDEILQKTKVDVNREGTEASAVTAIMVKNTAFVESKEYVVNLDRPFAFMIYDFEENIPLFMGKVMNME